MNEADGHMLSVDTHQALPWDQFKECIFEHGELRFAAVEKNWYEECRVAPGSGNDVIVAEVLVV
jgi:hypothetical protein